MPSKKHQIDRARWNAINNGLRTIRECVSGMARIYGKDVNRLIRENRHLTEGTPEREYWHHGYMHGLIDVLTLFESGGDLESIKGRMN